MLLLLILYLKVLIELGLLLSPLKVLLSQFSVRHDRCINLTIFNLFRGVDMFYPRIQICIVESCGRF
jgi:hypothetical protein